MCMLEAGPTKYKARMLVAKVSRIVEVKFCFASFATRQELRHLEKSAASWL